MREPDGDDRSVETRRSEELKHRDQGHLDRDHHQPDDHDEKDVLAGKVHPGEGVGAHGGDGELDHRGGERDQDAVDDRGRHVFRGEDLLVARKCESMWREQGRPPSGGRGVVPRRVGGSHQPIGERRRPHRCRQPDRPHVLTKRKVHHAASPQ